MTSRKHQLTRISGKVQWVAYDLIHCGIICTCAPYNSHVLVFSLLTAQPALVIACGSAPGTPNWGGLLARMYKAAKTDDRWVFTLFGILSMCDDSEIRVSHARRVQRAIALKPAQCMLLLCVYTPVLCIMCLHSCHVYYVGGLSGLHQLNEA